MMTGKGLGMKKIIFGAVLLAVTLLSAQAKEDSSQNEVPILTQKGGGLKADKILKFKETKSKPLNLHIFYPPDFKPSDSRPGIVFFFGGGWKGGNPKQFYPQAAYLASRGMVAICARYRTKSRYGAEPFDCVADGKFAIRYVRAHSADLGINPNKLAAGGGSAGGHVAAATATIETYNCTNDNLAVSAVPDALVLFNPVYDNGPNGYGYERVKDYYKKISPIHNLDGEQPPTLVMLGTRDKHLPVETAQLYEQRMEENGDRCETVIYPGSKHGFFNIQKDKGGPGTSGPEMFCKSVSEMDRFLGSLGYIPGEPTVKQWLAEQIRQGRTQGGRIEPFIE